MMEKRSRPVATLVLRCCRAVGYDLDNGLTSGPAGGRLARFDLLCLSSYVGSRVSSLLPGNGGLPLHVGKQTRQAGMCRRARVAGCHTSIEREVRCRRLWEIGCTYTAGMWAWPSTSQRS